MIEIQYFLASTAANSHGTILVHDPHGKKVAKDRRIRGDFLAICQKHMTFPTIFVFNFNVNDLGRYVMLFEQYHEKELKNSGLEP